MGDQTYEAIHISDIPAPEYEKKAGEPDWHPIRIHFGIRSFGTNAYTAAEPGGQLIEAHTESEDSDTRHEELYFVASGRATFTIADGEVDAPAGTFVYVPDPDAVRSAVCREGGTTVLCFGGTPGKAYDVSLWEQKYYRAQAR
jgi:hypothetical protein